MDSDEEELEAPSWKGISGSIVLINAYNPSQLSTPEISLQATCEVLRQNLRSSISRIIGVCVYGTKSTGTSTLAVPNIVQLLPLASPTLEDFKKIRGETISSHGQAKDFKLSEVFWHCSKMFANCKRQLSDRTVIMLTRLDVPPLTVDQRPTLKRIVDLLQLGINLRIINVSEQPYEVDPFYLEMLKTIHQTQDDVMIPEPVWNSKDIQKLMQQHSHRHLAVARLKFQITEGVTVGVGVYNLCRSQGMPKKIQLNRETNEIVTSNITTVKVQSNPGGTSENNADMETDGSENIAREVPLLKSEILHYQVYGNERIEFTDEELKQMKNPFGPPSMKLLGFKPEIRLAKEKWFLKQSAFLFPSENIIEGSTILFKALHKACRDKSVVAICTMCTRIGAKPRVVALSPCVKPLGLDVEMGFDIIYIPYLENLKDLPNLEDEEELHIDGTQTRLMRDLLETLTFSYKPDMFENPKLQCLYRAVEALALEEENVDTFVDTTKPEESKFDDVDYEKFNELFGPFGAIAPKRPTTSKDTGPAAKKAATDNVDENLLKSRIKSKDVYKYTVTELRQILKWKQPPNIPALTGLKKNELVKLVYECASN